MILLIPLCDHCLNPTSFAPGLNSVFPQMGAKQDKGGLSPPALWASCHTIKVFLTNGFSVFFFKFLRESEYKYESNASPLVDNASIFTQGKSGYENHKRAALSWASTTILGLVPLGLLCLAGGLCKPESRAPIFQMNFVRVFFISWKKEGGGGSGIDWKW